LGYVWLLYFVFKVTVKLNRRKVKMNCPKCGSAMTIKEKPAVTIEPDGTKSLKGIQQVWFCRDCKISSAQNPTRQDSQDR